MQLGPGAAGRGRLSAAPGGALSAPRLAGALHVEETLQEVKLQGPREDDDTALRHRPAVDVVVVGLEQEGVGPFPHPGKVVEPPHVEDVELQLANADLQTQRRGRGKEALQRGAQHRVKLQHVRQ